MNKKNYVLIIATWISSQILLFNNLQAEAKELITVNQFVHHQALDEAYTGFHTALRLRKKLSSVEFITNNAQGNISNASQIAKHHASLNPRFMIAIATPAMQAYMQHMSKDTTLGFLAVSNLEVLSPDKSKKIIGVLDQPPITELLTKLPILNLNIRKIGVISNAGEINSKWIVEHFLEEAKKGGYEAKQASVNSLSEVRLAVDRLIANGVQAIYIPQDNMVVSSLGQIARQVLNRNIILIGNDPTLSDKGVDLAIGISYRRAGLKLGNMVADLMEGKNLKKKIISSLPNEERTSARLQNMLKEQQSGGAQ